MKILLIVLLLLFNFQKLFASSQICSWIINEPFEEKKEESKDQIKILDKIN